MSTLSIPQKLKTWSFNARLIRYGATSFTIHTIFTLLLFSLQIVPGLIIKAVFDSINTVGSGGGGAAAGMQALYALVGLYVLTGVAQLVLGLGSEYYGWTFRLKVGALLRRNLFASILRRSGNTPLPISPGEAINRFRIDVGEVTDFPTWLPDQLGKWIAALAALIIMAKINLTITLVIFIPMTGVFILTRLAWARMIHYSRLSARKTDAVTGFVSEALGAVQAVKVADAETAVADHFHTLNEERATATIRLQLYYGLLNLMSNSMVTFGIGVVLLLAGQAIQEGTFTVGDFALFVSYLWFTTQVPLEIGAFYGDYKTQEVSIDRMVEIMHPDPAWSLAEFHPVYEKGALPEVPSVVKSAADHLEQLDIQDLTYHYPSNGSHENHRANGIEHISLRVRRGEFVVITGRVGSGKTTLLRSIAGILPAQGGEICWNGKSIEEPSSWMRPPRCAYTSQVPRLFSEPLKNNILMGMRDDNAKLAQAVYQSVLEPDIQTLENGLDTLVGPRGIRLSGGQVQRAAAARSFIRKPELLILDDLSSALDVETEHTLWKRLDEARSQGDYLTCLVVSHRKAALRRADHIIILRNGQVEAQGSLEELLHSCDEMQRLWKGEVEDRDVDQ